MILLTANDQLNANFADMWLHSGSCIRMIIPLRLHEAVEMDTSNLTGFGEKMRLKAKTKLEQAEMDRTWWMAYLLDRSISVWTNRPATLPEDEITCALPVLQSTYDNYGHGVDEVELQGVQSILDNNLYIEHPIRHQDSLVMYLKAIKLFSDTHRFFRIYQRQPHTVERYRNDIAARLLVSQANSFRMSIPESMRRPTRSLTEGGQLDKELLLGAMYAQATSLILAQPYMFPETWQEDAARVGLTAIRAILSLIYDSELPFYRFYNMVRSLLACVLVISTSYDISLLPASFAYLTFLAAKGLIRFLVIANQSGQSDVAALYRSEMDVFRYAN
jgi:hypothetical protein